MLDRQDRTDATLAPEGYTPTLERLARRIADFATLGEALDYAAQGKRRIPVGDTLGRGDHAAADVADHAQLK